MVFHCMFCVFNFSLSQVLRQKKTSITEANWAILMVRIELVLFNTNNNYMQGARRVFLTGSPSD